MSREEFARINPKIMHFDGTSEHRVNYVLTMDDGIHLRRASPNAPTKAMGPALFDITKRHYVFHSFEGGILTEEYKALYAVHAGGTVPRTPTFPNPSAVELRWQVSAQGSYRLDILWYFGKRDRFGIGEHYQYTLYCEPILD